MKCLWISFFSLAALYAGDKEAPISSLWRVDNSIVTTECKSLSTMQAHFKNLYFDSDKHTFYTVDKKVDIRKAINLVENRGYKWKSDRSSKDKINS